MEKLDGAIAELANMFALEYCTVIHCYAAGQIPVIFESDPSVNGTKDRDKSNKW